MKTKILAENTRDNEITVVLSCKENEPKKNILFLNKLCDLAVGSKVNIYLERPINKRKKITVKVVDKN